MHFSALSQVARRMGVNLLDIEGYKKIFDSYDTNKNGVIENLWRSQKPVDL